MKEIIKNKWLPITAPVILLILVILSTVWLYWYNYIVEWKNEKLDTRISEKEAEIIKIKKDKNIQVFALISDNEKVLKKLESYSQITKLIEWLTYIEDNYSLNLEWFNYSNWVITTKAKTNPEKVSNAYIATSSFIKEYRKDKNAIFKLPFISKVSWNDNMSFNLKLEVKDNLIK